MPSTPAMIAHRPIDELAAGRHPLTGRVAARLRSRCGVPAGATVVVGVSGGADSTALLLALHALRERGEGGDEHSVEPIACHVNHGLREEADDDRRYVESLCARLRVRCVARVVDVAGESGNTQAAARRLRYEALVDVAGETGAPHVAVAHHADDQFETILMSLCRGAGLAGLAGMAWSTPAAGDTTIVRPLLDTRRAECESLCRAAGVDWRHDPTNESPDSARARLRAEVTPVLDELWPNAAERVTLAAHLLDYVSTHLERDLANLFGAPQARSWHRDALRAGPAVVIAAGLRRAALEVDRTIADRLTQSHLMTAADAILDGERRPRTFDWPGNLSLTVTSTTVSL